MGSTPVLAMANRPTRAARPHDILRCCGHSAAVEQGTRVPPGMKMPDTRAFALHRLRRVDRPWSVTGDEPQDERALAAGVLVP
jgi:hypothetical protein